jgi:P-type Ca2+ transporter type 2C
VWLAIVGVLMGAATLFVTSWATDPHGLELARTMGFTTFALSHVFFAISTKDERRTLFNLDTLSDKPLLVASGLALVTIILTTTFGPFQRLLETGALELEQWLVCIGAALVVPLASEIRKAVWHRSLDEVADEPKPISA